jgi:hypothetical protein
LFAKANVEVKRIANRKYPELGLGDSVKLYKKKRRVTKCECPFGRKRKIRSQAYKPNTAKNFTAWMMGDFYTSEATYLRFKALSPKK